MKGGQCIGDPHIATGCRTAAKSLFALRDGGSESKDKLTFRWTNGAAAPAEFADPLSTSD